MKTGAVSSRGRRRLARGRHGVFSAVAAALLITLPAWAPAGTCAEAEGANGSAFAAGGSRWVQLAFPSGGKEIRSIHVGKETPRSVSVTVDGSSTLYSSRDGGATWSPHASATGRPFEDLAGYENTYYALDAASNVYRSTDRGASWKVVSTYPHPASALDTGADASSLVMATGAAGLELSPAFSTDRGTSWLPGTGPSSEWAHAAGDPSRTGRFFVARAVATGTPLASTADGGASWADCAALPLPVHVTGIGVLPGGGPLVLATDTPGASPVYRSNDGGATWTASATGIGAGEAALCAFAGNPPAAYVATDRTVYASYDGGTTWCDAGAGLPEKPYTAVCASGGASNTVYAGASDGTFYELGAPYLSGIDPASGEPGDVVTVSGLHFGGGEDSCVYFAGVPAASYVSWSDTRIRVRVPGLAASGPLYVITPGGTSNSLTFTAEGHRPGSHTWYLAEGCTGSDSSGGFETWVLMQNPGTVPANVTVTFMTEEGLRAGPSMTVPPDSRTTVSVADFVPEAWSVAAMLTSDQPVTAERSVYWNAPGRFRQAATNSIGVASPSREWFLAEGCTGVDRSGTFETWVLVLNPNDRAARVSLEYMTGEGPVEGPAFTLPAFSRRSVDVSRTVPNAWSVSTGLTSDIPVVAERSMYLNTPAAFRQAATDSIGVRGGATTWYLAEGCTGSDRNGSFETWVLVQNPGSRTATAGLTYMTPEGAVEGPTVVLPPKTRQSVNVAQTVPGSWDVSTTVRSDEPVIAERAMYWSTGSCPRQAATGSVGVTAALNSWCLAEGCTGSGSEGSFETWVLVQNPGSVPANVDITYMTPEGRVAGPKLTLEPNTRRTVNAAETVPGCWDVSTMVTSDRPVIVERAMYWNASGVNRQAAHDSTGLPMELERAGPGTQGRITRPGVEPLRPAGRGSAPGQKGPGRAA